MPDVSTNSRVWYLLKGVSLFNENILEYDILIILHSCSTLSIYVLSILL